MLDIKNKFRIMSQVDLDALLPREDFRVVEDKDKQSKKIESISIYHLEKNSFFFPFLRKPDFQRETNGWEPKKICQFIESFLDGNLIPALILWQGDSKYIFVIDGAHRMSALASWVYDDYGDGEITKGFYRGELPEEQKAIAEKTRSLINREIGKFTDYKLAVTHPDKVSQKIRDRAANLSTAAMQLQWVIGDANTAEHSFFNINEQAAPIDDTEKLILKSRKKPNAIASRAIMHAGTGHKYWSGLDADKQVEIEKISKDINDMLFTPPYKTPITTTDLPLAGKAYSSNSLPLIFDLVNIANAEELIHSPNDDLKGEETLMYLKRTKRILNRISSKETFSLGLHPAIYFYSITGRYQVTPFLTFVELIKEYDKDTTGNLFQEFTSIRKEFEEFLLKYKNIINQMTTNAGSGLKGYRKMGKMFAVIIDKLKNNELEDKEAEILNHFNTTKEFDFLKPQATEMEETKRKDFSTGVKSATFLKEALSHSVKCGICGGYIHLKSTSVDHVTRKREGGLGNIDNAQITHPYCNTTFKN
jgi:hypothetical protein